MRSVWFRGLLVAVAVVFSVRAIAHDGTHRAGSETAPVRAWDFTLPTLDGSRFVQASGIAGPLLVNFWGRDCPPCVAELPRLQAFAQRNPGWTVLLVATDAPGEASSFLQQRGITLPALRPGANVSGLMRAAGNRAGALPFTVALRDGTVCRTQLGEVSDDALAATVAECGAATR